MTVPCEGQLLLLTPPFEDQPLEPIVLGSVTAYPGLVDEHGTQVCHKPTFCKIISTASCLLTCFLRKVQRYMIDHACISLFKLIFSIRFLPDLKVCCIA